MPDYAPRQPTAARARASVVRPAQNMAMHGAAATLARFQTAADRSGAVGQLMSLQRAADTRPQGSPIQLKPIIRDDTGAKVDIGPKAMTLRALITLSDTLADETAIATAINEIGRRSALLPAGGPFAEGMFGGTYESDVDRNWADLHVVGELGGSLNPANLKTIFRRLYIDMKAHHAVSGVVGTLEWHPTGAVVTKQIAELLGEALGSWAEWWNARSAKMARKKADASGENPPRDKMAAKLDPALVPEHLAYLRSLKGRSGLDIAVSGGMPLPEGIHDLPEDAQMAALEQSMIDESLAGEARFDQYEAGLLDPDAPGPSMRIRMAHTHLPKLISKLP